LGAELGFQDIVHPPTQPLIGNGASLDLHCLADSDTRPNEGDKERENQLYRNEICADRRRNEAAIRQSEHEMQDADRRNPRNWRSPI